MCLCKFRTLAWFASWNRWPHATARAHLSRVLDFEHPGLHRTLLSQGSPPFRCFSMLGPTRHSTQVHDFCVLWTLFDVGLRCSASACTPESARLQAVGVPSDSLPCRTNKRPSALILVSGDVSVIIIPIHITIITITGTHYPKQLH